MILSMLCIEYLTIEINQEVEAEKSGVPSPQLHSGSKANLGLRVEGEEASRRFRRHFRREGRENVKDGVQEKGCGMLSSGLDRA